MSIDIAEAPAAGLDAREFLLTARDFARIAAIVHQISGIKLPDSKVNLVYSRLTKRLRDLRLRSFAEYCALVADPAQHEEREAMIAALTTNVTQFFREMHHFEHLKTAILPSIRAAAQAGQRVRLWSAACSSGQEPYSMALTILGAWPEAVGQDVKILATDIDSNMLAIGEAGVFGASVVKPIPTALRTRWFEKTGRGDEDASWRANAQLRSMVAFRKLNLIGDWPMRGPFQAIFCRNVVIYFDQPTQSKLWSRLVPLLSPAGALYIGHSERICGPAEHFLAGDGTTTYRPVAAGRLPA